MKKKIYIHTYSVCVYKYVYIQCECVFIHVIIELLMDQPGRTCWVGTRTHLVACWWSSSAASSRCWSSWGPEPPAASGWFRSASEGWWTCSGWGQCASTTSCHSTWERQCHTPSHQWQTTLHTHTTYIIIIYTITSTDTITHITLSLNRQISRLSICTTCMTRIKAKLIKTEMHSD